MYSRFRVIFGIPTNMFVNDFAGNIIFVISTFSVNRISEFVHSAQQPIQSLKI